MPKREDWTHGLSGGPCIWFDGRQISGLDVNARHVGVIGNLGHDSGEEELIGPGPCNRDLGGSINNSEAGYQRGSSGSMFLSYDMDTPFFRELQCSMYMRLVAKQDMVGGQSFIRVGVGGT